MTDPNCFPRMRAKMTQFLFHAGVNTNHAVRAIMMITAHAKLSCAGPAKDLPTVHVLSTRLTTEANSGATEVNAAAAASYALT